MLLCVGQIAKYYTFLPFSSIYPLSIPLVLELQLVKERKHFVILLANFCQEFWTQYD